MEFNIPSMPFIVLAVYLIIYVMKQFTFKTDEQRKSIPPVSAVIGGLIGIALFYKVPTAINAENIVEACTIGMGSGLAAVGCNQVFKQFKKFTGETETPDDEDNDRADNEDN